MLSKKNQPGEIVTLLTIAAAVIVGILAVASSSFLRNSNNKIGTNPQARVEEDYAQEVEVQPPAADTFSDQNTEQNNSEIISEPTPVPPQEVTPVPKECMPWDVWVNPQNCGEPMPTLNPKSCSNIGQVMGDDGNCYPPAAESNTSGSDPCNIENGNWAKNPEYCYEEWKKEHPVAPTPECIPGVSWDEDNAKYCYAKYAQEHPTPTSVPPSQDWWSIFKENMPFRWPFPSPTSKPCSFNNWTSDCYEQLRNEKLTPTTTPANLWDKFVEGWMPFRPAVTITPNFCAPGPDFDDKKCYPNPACRPGPTFDDKKCYPTLVPTTDFKDAEIRPKPTTEFLFQK